VAIEHAARRGGHREADLLAQAAAGQWLHGVHDADMVDEVVELELRLLEPEVRADRAMVERLLHPEFREFGTAGRVWDRASMVAALAEDPGPRAEASEVDARLVAPDVVLVTYIAGSAGLRSLRSSLWVRDEDGWRVLFHQGTRCLTSTS
jgi:hypothetical protein